MSEERDYEKEALADGWNPNYDGENKVDAKTFVERGEKINGMLKGKIGRLEERIDSLTQTNAEFKKYTDAQIKKEQEKNDKLISELEKVKAQAITDGDGAAAVQAEKDIQSLQANKPQTATEQSQAYNRMAEQWANENKWYATNERLGAFADGIAERVINEGYTGQAYFNELTRRTKEAFPEEFENPNKKKPGTVESGGDKGVKDSKSRNWSNLPADAKAQAERFIKDIPGYTKEQYLEQYDWD